MKYKYIAVQVEENKKYYAHVVKVSKYDNLLSKMKIKGIMHANICDTKKEAEKTAKFWNNCSKINKNYMFDETF